ncbi:hypothetical protein ILYODFUR_028636 [Ilyodon furcidens]|uniref:Uncharacterized protein n=1 Tax=Ilyodon furcidens TaxID=33524 RepID=A0ABV0UD93_9TELE
MKLHRLWYVFYTVVYHNMARVKSYKVAKFIMGASEKPKHVTGHIASKIMRLIIPHTGKLQRNMRGLILSDSNGFENCSFQIGKTENRQFLEHEGQTRPEPSKSASPASPFWLFPLLLALLLKNTSHIFFL